jgi:hypothetical protein
MPWARLLQAARHHSSGAEGVVGRCVLLSRKVLCCVGLSFAGITAFNTSTPFEGQACGRRQ